MRSIALLRHAQKLNTLPLVVLQAPLEMLGRAPLGGLWICLCHPLRTSSASGH